MLEVELTGQRGRMATRNGQNVSEIDHGRYKLPIICRDRRRRTITGKDQNGQRPTAGHIVSLVEKVLLFMVALCNRADHYIFILFVSFFLLSSSSLLFPRLISAVGDWMFTLIRHMVWP